MAPSRGCESNTLSESLFNLVTLWGCLRSTLSA